MTLAEFQGNPELVAMYREEIQRPFFQDVLIPLIREEFLRPVMLGGGVTNETAAYPHGVNVGSWRMFDAFTHLDRMTAPASEEPRADYGAERMVREENRKRGREGSNGQGT